MKDYSPLTVTLEAYTKNMRKLIEFLSDYAPNEHGFYSSLTTKINRNLTQYGDRVPEQYVPDWYNARKGQKRGLDIISATRLGYGGGLSKDPKLATALVYLALMGIWDVENESVMSMTTKLTGESPVDLEEYDDSTSLVVDHLERIELKVDRSLTILETTDHAVSKKDNLTWSVVKELTKFGMQPTKQNIPKIEEILLTHAVGIEHYVSEIIDILTHNKSPDPKYWLLLCVLLNEINPEGKYTPETIKSYLHPEAHRDMKISSPNSYPDK